MFKIKYVFLVGLVGGVFFSPTFANCVDEIPKLMFEDLQTLGHTISKNKISNIKKLDTLLYSFWKKCPQNSLPLWSRTPEDHQKYKEGVCTHEKIQFEDQKKSDIAGLNPQRIAYNQKREALASLIKKNQKSSQPDLTTQNKLTNELYTLHQKFVNDLKVIKERQFVCSLDTEEFDNTNGVLYLPWMKASSIYNMVMNEWGQGKVKEAFEFTFRKYNDHLQDFLRGGNVENQKAFDASVCKIYIQKYDYLRDLTHKKYLFVGLEPKDQLNILKCIMLKNKEDLSIKGQINTLWGKERSINIGIGIKTLEGLWNPWESISVYERVQSAKGYVDGLALFVDENDKSKVTTKPVYQWGICWVSTIFYQTVLGAYQDFKIERRSPHLSFYKLYYNYDGIDASLYGEKGHIYKDFKVTNVSNWPMLILTSTNGDQGKNQFSYYTTIWSMYPFKKSYIEYWKKYKQGKSTCITNKIIWMKNSTQLDSINSCYMGGMQ